LIIYDILLFTDIKCFIYLFKREQLREHEDTLRQLEVELDIHKKKPPERGTKNISLQFYKEKESHLLEEVSFIIYTIDKRCTISA